MFKKILYPTDFSDISNKVIAAIKQLKEAGTSEVVLIHVIDSRNLDAMVHWAPSDYQNTRKLIEDMAAENARETAVELEKEGIAVRVLITEGIPTQEILKAEKEEGVSSIIVGSHGKSNLKEFLLGSVSEAVVRKAQNPVIVIKR
ncbi:MAG: universal stress protein [Syntrophales bacterium]|nr:universal stress protein [Syntrophales bacterium]